MTTKVPGIIPRGYKSTVSNTKRDDPQHQDNYDAKEAWTVDTTKVAALKVECNIGYTYFFL